MKTIRFDAALLLQDETLATVGFFDGVHRGHRFLIDRMREQAQTSGRRTAVVTFPVHPRKALQQDYQPLLLTSFEERIERLAETGVDYCYLIDFTPAFAQTTACDFIQQILYRQLCVRELMIGYDHRFGRDRTDSYEQYVAYGRSCGMRMYRTERFSSADSPVSSTAIRRHLSLGEVRAAAEALACPYSLTGTVIHGNHLGRTIGFPTANLDLLDKDKIIPREGVYAVTVELQCPPLLRDGDPVYRNMRGMAYIGKRPTVAAAGEQRIEVHIFDFDEDIYGRQLRIGFSDFLRPDARFDSLEELKAQLSRDKRTIVAWQAERH
jgi:riboflavin kinase/FMN adenylyltransferase